jgi:O-antigen/teichoic acid export membrane protein
MTATRAFRVQVPLLLAVVAITIAACAVLIPRYGMMGAVAASGIGEVLQLFGSAYVVHRAVQERKGGPT